jgi:Cu2+-exporting ATPase
MQKSHANHNHPQEALQNHSLKPHSGDHQEGMHHDHGYMVRDFQTRFWASLALTVPVLLLSPMIKEFLGLSKYLSFKGDSYALFFFSSIIYFYGGGLF